MSGKTISLFLFVDAFGWEVFKRHPDFLGDRLYESRPLDTVFGFSSACDPSMITGKDPAQHKHWSSFYYDPKNSPFRSLKWLDMMPEFLANKHRVRHAISRLVARTHGYTGYFELYNVPFKYLPYFNYAEKKWMWGEKHGMVSGRSIFDELIDHNVPFYVKENTTVSDEEQFERFEKEIRKGEIAIAWVFFGKLDALMHQVGNEHAEVDRLIELYDDKIRKMIDLAESHYDRVNWYVFSDHGMHNVDEHCDLQADVNALGLEYGKDFVAMYDSTMARFWFLNEAAKKRVHTLLEEHPHGYIVSDELLKKWGTFFPDHQYGETRFLLNPSTLLVPSFMGEKPVRGMHGYSPEEPDSVAMVTTNQALPQHMKSIKDIYSLMLKETNLNEQLISTSKNYIKV